MRPLKFRKHMPALRNQVNYRLDALNWDFLKLMAEVAAYADSKYGNAVQYTESRLEGDKSPTNHIAEHLHTYLKREVHDHFGTLKHQLAAIAYGAMIEFYYLKNGGPTSCDALYRPVGTYDFSGDGKPKETDLAIQGQSLTDPGKLNQGLAQGIGGVDISGTTSAGENLKKKVLNSGK